MQVDPIKPKLNPPGTKRLKLNCDKLLPTSAFKFDLRRYTTASPVSGADVRERMHHLALRSEFKRAVHLIRAAVKIWSTDTFYKKKYREQRLLSPLDPSGLQLDPSGHLD